VSDVEMINQADHLRGCGWNDKSSKSFTWVMLKW